VVFSHHPKHALLIDSQAFEMPVRPEPPVAPKRVLGLESLDGEAQAFITLRHPERPPPRQPSNASLFILQREFPNQRLYPGVLARQAGFFPILWLDFNGPQDMREKRVAPLIIEGLADLGLMHNSAMDRPCRP
jgi:hypothetical protein